MQAQPYVKRQQEYISEDVWRCCNPDIQTPFRNLQDALDRLLPYHVGRLQPYCLLAHQRSHSVPNTFSKGPDTSMTEWQCRYSTQTMEERPTTTVTRQRMAHLSASRRRQSCKHLGRQLRCLSRHACPSDHIHRPAQACLKDQSSQVPSRSLSTVL